MTAFHEVRFPLAIALGSRGGPERKTDIVTLGSGREQRNARWAHSRRRYNAGYGVKSLADLQEAVAFFEERRGRLHGFRWRDRLDDRSCTPGGEPEAGDQVIGTGDGQQPAFALVKTYGSAALPYVRPINKPVTGTIRVAVAGMEVFEGSAFDCDAASGTLTFRQGHVPPPGALVTAGFLFDVPVRFDTDFLEVDLASFAAGEILSIPLVEIII